MNLSDINMVIFNNSGIPHEYIKKYYFEGVLQTLINRYVSPFNLIAELECLNVDEDSYRVDPKNKNNNYSIDIFYNLNHGGTKIASLQVGCFYKYDGEEFTGETFMDVTRDSSICYENSDKAVSSYVSIKEPFAWEECIKKLANKEDFQDTVEIPERE